MGALTYCLYLTQHDFTVAVLQMNYYGLLQNKGMLKRNIV